MSPLVAVPLLIEACRGAAGASRFLHRRRENCLQARHGRYIQLPSEKVHLALGDAAVVGTGGRGRLRVMMWHGLVVLSGRGAACLWLVEPRGGLAGALNRAALVRRRSSSLRLVGSLATPPSALSACSGRSARLTMSALQLLRCAVVGSARACASRCMCDTQKNRLSGVVCAGQVWAQGVILGCFDDY